MKVIRSTSLILLLVALLAGCSHDYESNTLDLGFYQWNLWVDPDGEGESMATSELDPPSCGWEVLHRGNGKLVRVPALISDHYPSDEYSGATWFHCRYTLPELWDKKKVVLACESAGYRTDVYLNEQLAGSHLGSNTPFEIDLTEHIFYTRDNHLSIRITDPEYEKAGIPGTLVLKISENVEEEAELK